VSAPLASEHWKTRNMEAMHTLYRQVSSVSLFIGLFLFMCVWINRYDFLSFLSPEKQLDFLPGIWVFLALMCGRILDMYFGLNGSILVSSKKYKYDIVFTSILIVTVILLNLWLIPIWGIVGAAISTACAYFGYNIIRLIFVWYHFGLHPFAKSQFMVMALFALNVLLFEFIPFDFGGALLNIFVKTAVFCALFAAPVYFFRIEPEIIRYVDKVRLKLLGR
jgi:O-antigen/teichoic acid export membrane protein